MASFLPRSLLLPEIKKGRRRELGESFTGKTLSVLELTNIEFLAIACLYQLNLSYVLVYMDLAGRHGAIMVSIFYVLLTAILGMPLFMLFTFMSSYSMRSYLTFWKCVPLFEGLGYGLVVLRLAAELQNITMSSLALLLLISFFSGHMKKHIMSCDHNTTDCVPMYPTENMTVVCANSSKYVVTSSQNYVDYMTNMYSAFMGNNLLNLDWLLLTGLAWIIVLILTIFGLHYIKRVIITVQLFCGGIMFFISIFGVSYTSWTTIKRIKLAEWADGKVLFEFQFWVDLLLHAAEINVLANMIWLGTLKPKTLHPKYAAIIVSSLKLTAFVLFLCFSSCLLKENIVHYKYMDPRCFQLNPQNVMFTMVPDVLFRTKVYNLYVPLWYLCLFVFAILPPLYSMIGLVDSILQKHTQLCKYRIYLIIGLCVTGFVCSLFHISRGGRQAHIQWKLCVVPLWTAAMLLLVALAIFFIYSTRAVIEDYLFIYGIAPERYWITSWKSTPILAVLAFILVIHNQYTYKLCVENTFTAVLSHTLTALALLPVIVVFFATCFKHVKHGTLHNLAKPDPDWGPSDIEKKAEKALFYPQRDIRYRNINLKCRHNCIAERSTDLETLLLNHRRRLKDLDKEMSSSRFFENE